MVVCSGGVLSFLFVLFEMTWWSSAGIVEVLSFSFVLFGMTWWSSAGLVVSSAFCLFCLG